MSAVSARYTKVAVPAHFAPSAKFLLRIHSTNKAKRNGKRIKQTKSTTINVKNENTKTVKFETDKTQRSSYLKELIKILLIREFREKNNNVGMENRYFENNENKYMTRMQKNRNFYKDISHFDIYENIYIIFAAIRKA